MSPVTWNICCELRDETITGGNSVFLNLMAGRCVREPSENNLCMDFIYSAFFLSLLAVISIRSFVDCCVSVCLSVSAECACIWSE